MRTRYTIPGTNAAMSLDQAIQISSALNKEYADVSPRSVCEVISIAVKETPQGQQPDFGKENVLRIAAILFC